MEITAGKQKGAGRRGVPPAPPSWWSKWKIVVELSSAATLASFLISAAILYSVFTRHGVQFAAAVGLNDIATYGIGQLFSTIAWVFYLVPVILLAHVTHVGIDLSVGFTGIYRPRLVRRVKIVWMLVAVVAAWLTTADFSVRLDGWRLSPDIAYTRRMDEIGLLWIYLVLLGLEGLYVLLFLYVKYEREAENGLLRDAVMTIVRANMPGSTGLILILGAALTLAGYAAYSSLDLDFERGIGRLDADAATAACGVGQPATVSWIGESSILVRCSAGPRLIKGAENLPVELTRHPRL